ncbi:MAG TPA: hypothetical protein VHH35_00650, partial [Pyrinomonadaceae bacterium]|nr:hypothetical protein [Pyrinomonadaceae bacterium]
MNRLQDIASRLLMLSVVLCLCLVASTMAQTPTSSPSQETAKPAKEEADPFAPEKAAPLPPGMTGSDVNDPRAKLTPGVYDAGEAALGIRHILLLKKPDAFHLGSNDPDSAQVQKILGQVAGGDAAKLPKASQLVAAQLAFANSDLAF